MGDNIRQDQVEISIESLEAANFNNPNDNDNVSEEEVEKSEPKGECRYCHEEELVSRLEAPCGCDGSLKYAHRTCVSHWCNVKRNIFCEICKQVFSPNYSVIGPPPLDDDIVMSERWRIPGTNIRMVSPFVLIQHGINRLLRSMNTDFTLRNPTPGVIFGTLLLLFVASMIIRDAYYYTPPKEDTYSWIMYMAVIVISVPIYILSWLSECRNRGREDHQQ
ncbi:RING/FYVE/PHD zinc finger superfamily protein [Trifolium repens]|nr:RING/FYVE/PHD zinc finger superfamily protein [Trifolium repens]